MTQIRTPNYRTLENIVQAAKRQASRPGELRTLVLWKDFELKFYSFIRASGFPVRFFTIIFLKSENPAETHHHIIQDAKRHPGIGVSDGVL